MRMLRAYLHLARAILASLRDPHIVALFSVNAMIVSITTLVYARVEGWPYLEALYFSVVTISTVGYGDFAPHSATGKVFTVGYIVVGVGMFVGFVGALAEAIIRRMLNRK